MVVEGRGVGIGVKCEGRCGGDEEDRSLVSVGVDVGACASGWRLGSCVGSGVSSGPGAGEDSDGGLCVESGDEDRWELEDDDDDRAPSSSSSSSTTPSAPAPVPKTSSSSNTSPPPSSPVPRSLLELARLFVECPSLLILPWPSPLILPCLTYE